MPRISNVRYIRYAHSLGVRGLCQLAAAGSGSDFVVLLRGDTRALPNWLDELVGTLRARPRAGLVGSMMVDPEYRLLDAGARARNDGSLLTIGRGRTPICQNTDYAREVDFCSAASVAMPRSTCMALNEFAPDGVSSLSQSLRENGKETWYQPLSSAIHYAKAYGEPDGLVRAIRRGEPARGRDGAGRPFSSSTFRFLALTGTRARAHSTKLSGSFSTRTTTSSSGRPISCSTVNTLKIYNAWALRCFIFQAITNSSLAG